RDLAITAESDLLDFAVMVASRLTYEIGRLDREAAKANLSRALRLVSSKTDVLIRVHPDDLATMAEFADSVLKQAESSPAVRLEADESMAPGGCRVRSEPMEIDATLETQIDAMVALLLGKTKADD
ncbi:MAG: flagellar assembly protein FliH, partial [Planctomycetes bacterium]|nr:flagellar assembly protein FliH [Planctomycetota bacterium]